MHVAQEAIPNVKRCRSQNWKTSARTLGLVERRVHRWSQMNDEGRKSIKKEISRSARDDYRAHINNLVIEMEKANEVGNITQVYRTAKKLSSKQNGSTFCQPSKDTNGNLITSTEQQLELWAKFLEGKFVACVGEPNVDLQSRAGDEGVDEITLEEVKVCVSQLKSGKASGPDEIPVEQFKKSETACKELHLFLTKIWENEDIPSDFVLAIMMMLHKKKSKDDRKNYRALALLNHAYKVFAMIILMRIVPYIEPKLSDMQSGFRKNRGCRDNILILAMSIHHLLESAEEKSAKRAGIITYIDFVAAFDSIKHSYLLTALKQYGVPLKYRRLIQAIYNHAAVKVRLQEAGGVQSFSRDIPIRRGALQGDILSPEGFIIALDKLLKEHGGLDVGLPITPQLTLSELEFADDAALPTSNVDESSSRLTTLNENAKQEAGMEISIPKTKVQHIRKRPRVSETTEDDVYNLPEGKKFEFRCEACDMTYPTKHGLAVHKGRWCKRSKTAKKPSRK